MSQPTPSQPEPPEKRRHSTAAIRRHADSDGWFDGDKEPALSARRRIDRLAAERHASPPAPKK